ncbi:hypothetical protein LMB78_02340, partial [Limosilactobacillus reuteri]|uniref:hypothetical protein n=1 Tax=Limosilactobacillus reuteri TaxID=1598 RepID=UPI001E4FB619
LPRDITAPSTNNQLVSIIYLSPVANLFLKFRALKRCKKESIFYFVDNVLQTLTERRTLQMDDKSKTLVYLC